MSDRERAETGDRVCECGCGQPTPLASHTQRRDGVVKGQPNRYLRYHRRHQQGRRDDVAARDYSQWGARP